MDYFARKDFPGTLRYWDGPRKDFPRIDERLTLSGIEFGLGLPNGLLCEEGLPRDAVLLGLGGHDICDTHS